MVATTAAGSAPGATPDHDGAEFRGGDGRQLGGGTRELLGQQRLA